MCVVDLFGVCSLVSFLFYSLPVSGIAPVMRFASSPRTLAITRCGEFEPLKMAPPNFENRAESPPLAPSEEATVFLYGKSIESTNSEQFANFDIIKLFFSDLTFFFLSTKKQILCVIYLFFRFSRKCYSSAMEIFCCCCCYSGFWSWLLLQMHRIEIFRLVDVDVCLLQENHSYTTKLCNRILNHLNFAFFFFFFSWKKKHGLD